MYGPNVFWNGFVGIRGMNNTPGTIAGTSQREETTLQLEVRSLDEIDIRQWDDFVMRHPDSTPFHLLAWKHTIEQSFNYRAMYLVATDDEGIRGVLPLFLVENRVIGKALISSPFAVYGGILADGEQALRSLHQHVGENGQPTGGGLH